MDWEEEYLNVVVSGGDEWEGEKQCGRRKVRREMKGSLDILGSGTHNEVMKRRKHGFPNQHECKIKPQTAHGLPKLVRQRWRPFADERSDGALTIPKRPPFHLRLFPSTPSSFHGNPNPKPSLLLIHCEGERKWNGFRFRDRKEERMSRMRRKG